MQLDRAEKGFSFMKEGPLDMRMDPSGSLTAEEIVNNWSEKELGRIFKEFGEEPRFRKAAEVICAARQKQPIRTTKQLADILASSIHGKKRLHPATLVFQALRIYVNDELGSIERALIAAIQKLAPGGRVGVVSFHSLEDRIVKNIFRDASKVASKRERGEKKPPLLRLLTKKPLTATHIEIRQNPRARSAKLRFAERVGVT